VAVKMRAMRAMREKKMDCPVEPGNDETWEGSCGKEDVVKV
jgi:hypothetical protein